MRVLYRRPHCGAAGLSAVPRRGHAVVVGGSLAGMLAARVLSDHFDRVTLLERDRFPETPAARKGLPQGRHVHALLERGRGIMERFLPGLTGELVRAGAGCATNRTWCGRRWKRACGTTGPCYSSIVSPART
jgi:NADPH-dependent 2,4-dienoyl-CoA reductase/sulfur reductase-like enzyme